MASRWMSNYLRHMHEPLAFQWLRFPDCLEPLPWSKAECLARVPQHTGRHGQRFTPYGLVWLGLLSCPPFNGLPQREMRDVRTHRPYQCQKDRDILFSQVVDVLLSHEANLTRVHDWPQFRMGVRLALPAIRALVQTLVNLHARNISPVSEKLHRRAEEVKHAFNLLVLAYEELTEEDYQRGRIPEPRGTQTWAREQHDIRLRVIYESFIEIGPEINQRIGWTKTSIYHAMAAIAKHFGLRNERNQPLTPEGIRKTLERGRGQ
jgi:hypothetical protein